MPFPTAHETTHGLSPPRPRQILAWIPTSIGSDTHASTVRRSIGIRAFSVRTGYAAQRPTTSSRTGGGNSQTPSNSRERDVLSGTCGLHPYVQPRRAFILCRDEAAVPGFRHTRRASTLPVVQSITATR